MAEQTRRQAELTRQALDLAPVMIRDLDGTIRLWTNGMTRLYGHAPDAATGRRSHELLETEFPQPLEAINATLLATGQWAGELVHRRRDGARVVTASLWALSRDDHGAPVAVTEVNQDITAQKQDEQARLYLAAIVESSEDPIIGKTLDGIVTSWNKAAETVFGFGADEIVGQPIAMIFPPERLTEEDEILHRLGRGERLDHYATVRRRKDGVDIDVVLTVSPIRNAAGTVIGISKIVRDVTERMRAEADLDRLRAELLHVSRLGTMGQMASTLAHELNQPLTAAANYLGALRRVVAGAAGNDRRIEEIATKAIEQTARAGDIIRRLRAFVTRGETERRLEALNGVVEEAMGLALVGAQQHRVVPSVRLADALPEVLIDRVQIQQVILNLVRNAVEAMEHSAHRDLTVETRRDGALVELQVADTGPGIAPEMTGRLFDAFATTKATGMGVGLSICREIVEAHGGRLTVAANPGGGTIFTVALPAAATGTEP